MYRYQGRQKYMWNVKTGPNAVCIYSNLVHSVIFKLQKCGSAQTVTVYIYMRGIHVQYNVIFMSTLSRYTEDEVKELKRYIIKSK